MSGCNEGIKLGISDGEVMGNILLGINIIKLGGDEGSDLAY